METKKRTEKDRISAVLFIVVFLLVVVIVIMVLKTVDDKRAAQQAQEQQTINTMTYQPPVQDPGALVNGDVNTETPQNFEAVTVLPNSNSNSGGYTANAGNTGTGKAEGVALILRHFALPADAAAVVGDDYHDMEMILAHNGWAVSSGKPDVVKKAPHTCESVGDLIHRLMEA